MKKKRAKKTAGNVRSVPFDDLRNLFCALDSVIDKLAVAVLALKGQNAEQDREIAKFVQQYCNQPIERAMSVVEQMAGVREGTFWDETE
jgi:uncharacterized protein Yka (UPF0111/DUF47 family)